MSKMNDFVLVMAYELVENGTCTTLSEALDLVTAKPIENWANNRKGENE